MKKLFKGGMSIWTSDLITMAIAIFFMRFGEGLLGGARTNFFVDTLSLTGGQVLWLEGIREIPGLALVFIAALTMQVPIKWRASAWAAVLGVGYMLFALVHSYLALLVMAVFASFGMHGYMPLQPVLGMAMATESTRGRVLGSLASVGSLATIVGMGVLALVSGIFEMVSLRWSYVIGGAIILISAVLLARLPSSLATTRKKEPRMVFRKRYWLYYVLTFFEGSRKQVLGTFGTLVLVDLYAWKVWQISTLLLISAVVNLLLSPYLGTLVDRYGSRAMLASSYLLLTLACVGYAVIPVPIVLAILFVVIRLLIVLGLGLSIYVNEIAPPEELTPTLSAGISINHVTSVAMPIVAGVLLPVIHYSGIFAGTAALIAMSIPFALAMRAKPPAVAQMGAAPAE